MWPDQFVEEGNLTQHVYALRKALGEGGGSSTSRLCRDAVTG
ncbi:MAG: hypothetical protein LC775_03320 [Acidobacteria bacterium]|nr:hypothetical protein [Acidobacteriota bacterium]